MAISSIEEILEQRRRQAETKKRNEEKAKRDAQRQQYGPQTQAQAQAAKQEKPQFFAGYGAQPTKAPVKAPARNPVYAPIKFVPAASDRTKDDQAQPARYVPVPYQVPEMEKDKDKPARYTPMPYGPAGMGKDTPALIPVGRPMEIGLTSDRPDTGVADLNQTQIAQAPTTALDPRGWRPERTKDDEAFPAKKKPWYTDWGKDSPIGAGAALEYGVQQMGAAKDFLRPDTGATNNPAWDYLDRQKAERAAKYGDGLGTGEFTNPLEGAVNNPADLQTRIEAITAGESTENVGLFDTKKIGENVIKNVAATPGLGQVWRGTGDFLANAGDTLQAFSNDALSTRVPTPMADGSVTNDASLGEATSAFFYAFNDTFNPWSPKYNPTAAADESNGAAVRVFFAPVRPWRAFAENFQDNITGIVESNVFGQDAGGATGGAPGMVRQDESGPLPQGWKRPSDRDRAWLDPLGKPGGEKPNLPTREEIANAQAQVRTLLWASSPDQRAQALDQIVTRESTIAQLTDAAQRLKDRAADPSLSPQERSHLSYESATYGMMANDLRETTANDIIDQNTNVLRTGVLSVLVDPVDWIMGGAIKVAGLAPGARRLAKAAGEVFGMDEAQVAARLAALDLGPDIRKIADTVPEADFLTKVDTAIFRPATTRAAIDAQSLYGGIAAIIKDTDNIEDAKLLLQTLARQPSQLVTGIPVNLFSSARIQATAVDGMVKIVPGVFSKGFVDAVERTYRSIADDVLQLPILQAGGAYDKKEVMDTLLVALKQGGARAYGVATAFGEAPMGTVRAQAKMTGNGNAVIEYIDQAKKIIGTSAEMTAGAARRAAAALEAQVKTGKIADTNYIKLVGDKQRQIMSAVWLNTRPGTMIQNALGGHAMMLIDGDWTFKPIDELMDHAAKFFGGGQFNTRMGGADQAASYWGGWGLGKLRGGMANFPFTGGRVGLGEENLAARAWYGAFSRGFNKLWDRSLAGNMTPIFDAIGITDSQFRKNFTSTLRDMGRSGDKQGMINAVGDLVAGRARAFSVGDLNPIYVEALTPDGLTELNQLIRTSTPQTVDLARKGVTEIIDRDITRWQNYLLTDPSVPKRGAWSSLEITQDGGDIMRDAENAIKAGADPAITRQVSAAIVEHQKEVQQQLETLTQLVADANDPAQRYVLYNVWSDLYDAKSAVRMQQAELAEAAQEAGGAAWKQEYYPQVTKLWEAYGQQADTILARAQKALTDGVADAPRYDAWSMLQRQAERSTEELRAIMQAEPGSGKFDARLKQTIEAGRAFEDKAVARTYAAARRFNIESAMDYIVSAERDSQLFGAQGTAYIQKSFDEVVAPALKAGDRKAIDAAYKNYYQIRNQVWREVRDAQYERWESATRQIVQEGVGRGLGQGMKFDLGGTMGPATLIGPGTGKNKGMWGVVLEDGQVHYLPGEDARKTTGVVTSEQFFVPNEAIKHFENLKDESNLAVSMEMDNLSSAEVARRNAPAPRPAPVRPVHTPGTPTATEIAYKERDAKRAESIWNASGATQQTAGGLPARTVMPPPVTGVTKSRLPNMGDIAKEQMAAIIEARNSMRAEWDRIAVGEWNLPKLDTLVMQYQRDGIVNIPENLAEDIYGNVIAGNRIDSQQDVESFIVDYVAMKRQTDKAAATAAQAVTYSKMNRDAIIEARGVDLAEAGYTDAQLAKMNRREVITALEAIDEVTPDELGVVGYDGALGGPETVRLWSENKTDNLLNIGNLKNDSAATMHEVVEDLTQRVGDSGNYAHWTLGDAAARQIDVLRSMERNLHDQLDAILAYTPEALNPNQQLRFMDAFMRKVLPDFDNAALAAAKFGDKMQAFSMVDFTNNYHFDNLLAAVGVPYHFWYSRTIKNAVERAIFNPGVYSKLAAEQRLIGVQNDQDNVQARDEGKITVTVGGRQYHIGAGMFKYIPYLPIFLQNDYANPEEVNNSYSFAVETSKMANFGPNPAWDIANKLLNGQGDQIDWAGQTPITKLARDAAQYAGVNLPAALDRPNNEYLVGREASRMALEKFQVDGQVVTENEAKMVQDLARQIEMGEGPLPEQKAIWARMQAIYDAASSRVGGEKLQNNATSFLANAPVYSDYEADRQASEATDRYFGLQYGPENKFGSLEAAKADRDPGSTLTRKAVTDPDALRPGVSAVNDQKSAEKQTIFGEMNAAVEAFLAKNPGATRDEIDGIQSPFYARVKALDEKYPSAQAYEGSGQPPKGMNPKERAQWELNRILYSEPEGKPVMPENATPEQERAYYAQYNEWKIKQFDLIEQNVAGLLRLDPTEQADVQGWQGELVKLVKNQYASELLRNFENRFSGENYKGWDDTVSLQEEMTRAQWAEREAAVTERVGAEAAALLQQYYGLPKGSEERRKFKAAHPIIAQAMVASFTPEKYDEVTEKFGADAWTVYANRPVGPGTGATEDQLAAYYAQLDQYNAQHPGANAAYMYVRGRSRQYNPDAGSVYMDWGQDYNEAIRIFGPNIFEIVDNFPDGKTAQSAYYKAHPELSGYWEWNKALKGTMAPAQVDPELAPLDPATYTGERPVGSGRVPVTDEAGRPTTGAASFFPGFTGASRGDFAAVGAPSATMPTETQAAAAGEATGATVTPGAAGDRTWQDWAAQNPNYGKYGKGNPEFAAATAAVGAEFDADGLATWNAYYDLPKDSAAREEYKRAHPELRVMTMAGYNPDEYKQAKELFGDDAWTEWANIPPYDESDDAKAARAAYLDAHPQAKLLSAWVNGRPGNFDESATGDDFAYNFGADFSEAESMFGEDIWSIWAGYSSKWDKATKRAYHERFPNLGPMMDWWYGNEAGQGRAAGAGAARSYGGGGGRSYGGGGGGGGYSGWGGGDDGGWGQPVDLNMPYVQAEQLSRELQTQAPRPAQHRNFSPDWWIKAGDRTGPDPIKPVKVWKSGNSW